jgi:hypothetical protein
MNILFPVLASLHINSLELQKKKPGGIPLDAKIPSLILNPAAR